MRKLTLFEKIKKSLIKPVILVENDILNTSNKDNFIISYLP